jgi:uncharacterized membrane protein YgcG
MDFFAIIVFVVAGFVFFLVARALFSASRLPGRGAPTDMTSSASLLDTSTTDTSAADHHQRHLAQHLAHHHGVPAHEAALMQAHPGSAQHIIDHHNATSHAQGGDFGSAHGGDFGSSHGGGDFGSGSDFGGGGHH